jgi:aryl-alcohol dehydrogenase-like predicted oxidoreductase
LGVTTIDTFVLSSALSSSPSVKKTWKSLEAYYHEGVIDKLGVSDFSEQQLTDVLGNPDFCVKPSVNQVNYNCCELPASMVQLAKQNDVALLYTLDCQGKGLHGMDFIRGRETDISFLSLLCRNPLKARIDWVDSAGGIDR